MISIVFPHQLLPENNKLLELNLEMLKSNTRCEYEVLYLANQSRADLVYKGWNQLIENAQYDLVLWHNSDLLLAPDWDVLALKYRDKFKWLCLRVIECGRIPSADSMLSMKEFGDTPENFKREEFEEFVAQESKKYPEIENKFTWYCPSVLNRDWFLEMGGFNTDPSFPHSNDIEFRNKIEAKGFEIATINSWAFHFQYARINLPV